MAPNGLHAIVLGGGPPIEPSALRVLRPADLVVAADSGLHHASVLGITVDHVVGDLDSVDPRVLDAAVTAGATVDRHPAAKDHTDLELALGVAVGRGATSVTVIAGFGGRVDHQLGAALLLASPAYADVIVDAWLGDAWIGVVHGGASAATRELVGGPGRLVTLLAVHGVARGVHTVGLEYPLAGDDLHPGSTRGVSNVMASAVATVTVEAGTLLVVLPGGNP